MTGFGAAEGPVGAGRLRVELKTVNHRFFNFAPRLPAELAPLEGDIRERLRRDFERGHVACSARWVEAPAGGVAVRVDEARAAALVGELRRVGGALGLRDELSVETLLRLPDVVAWGTEAPVEVPFSAVEPVVAAAAAACRAQRLREGAALAADLRERFAALAAAAHAVEGLAPQRLERERSRLRAAVAELVAGHAVDEQRIAHEVALAADRLDIAEELTRLRTHLAACEAALAGDGPAGKPLGFLAQELGREVNTIGSKANDATITAHVLVMKGELERVREQLENLE